MGRKSLHHLFFDSLVSPSYSLLEGALPNRRKPTRDLQPSSFCSSSLGVFNPQHDFICDLERGALSLFLFVSF